MGGAARGNLKGPRVNGRRLPPDRTGRQGRKRVIQVHVVEALSADGGAGELDVTFSFAATSRAAPTSPEKCLEVINPGPGPVWRGSLAPRPH